MSQKTKEEILFEDIYFNIKYGIYLSVFFYAIAIINEHNTLMRLPWSYTCDEYLDKEDLEINE